MSPSEAQYCQANLGQWEQLTNNFSLEDSKEQLSKNIRDNQLTQNEFVSGFIADVN